MIGAIAGDIIGSVFEKHGITRVDGWGLFDGEGESRFTDDTILTVATMDALLNPTRFADGERDLKLTDAVLDPKVFARAYKHYGRTWPGRGYGRKFELWCRSDSLSPYQSFGNGSAMRVGPVGLWAEGPAEKVLQAAAWSASATHNLKEAIDGAQAVALSVWMARHGEDVQTIRAAINRRFDYDLNRTIADIRPKYRHDVTCSGSVPEAIVAALEGTSWEESVRLAVSLGGDADTQAAMAGAIAEARFGVPEWIQAEARRRLPAAFIEVLDAFYRKVDAGERGCADGGGERACPA